jgi:hypothetical protein
MCVARKSFPDDGFHDVNIKVFDDAGNEAETSISFTIV